MYLSSFFVRFDVPATEPVVRGFSKQLLQDIRRDGLSAVSNGGVGDATTTEEFTLGQFDALFSLNKRRNEVWIELSDHPWK